MTLTLVGTGIVAGAVHSTVPNLWVREVDSTLTVYPPPVLTGVIKGQPTADVNIYSHGCVLTQVDGTTSLSAQWENTGTYASPSWQRWSV